MLSALYVTVFVALTISSPSLVTADDSASDVFDLTVDTFSSSVETGQWLVEFYAPWCGHCKRLAPVWAQAATSLKGTVSMGKVDCTSHKEVCTRYDVEGYPSIKFIEGAFNHSYEGPRTLSGIRQYAKRMTGPTVSKVNGQSLDKMVKSSPVVFTLFTKPSTPSSVRASDAFASACLELKDRVTCTAADDGKDVAKYQAGSAPSLVCIKDGEHLHYSGAFDSASIVQWLRAHQFVLVTDFTLDNFHSVAQAGKKTVIAAVDPQAPGITAIRKTLKTLAREFRDSFNFGILDGVEHYQFTQNFGIKLEHLPIVFVLDAPEQIHYVDFEVGLDQSSLSSWLEEVSGGKVEGKGSNFFTKALKIARQTFTPLVDLVAENLYISMLAAGILLFLMFRLILSLDDEGEPTSSSSPAAPASTGSAKPKED